MLRSPQVGIVVVGHGSRREEANEDLRTVARKIAARGEFSLVQPAFLEIVRPTIDEAFSRCVDKGATHVIVHPYFLSPGRHTRGDIPVEVRSAAGRHNGITYEISEPLAAHDLVIQASVERIRDTANRLVQFSHVSPTRPAEAFQHAAETTRAEPGTVYLVGAGPGDPGLLTVKALELLREADVVVYDYLVNAELLSHVRPTAECIYVGKKAGCRHMPQAAINQLLVASAHAGEIVVRLKGGDPFLFGRGGEEALELEAAGVPFEIVPGVSSALAVPAYAGIPLTHRGLSSSVAILTGASAGDGQLSEEFRNCEADTLIVLMGTTHLRSIASQLIASGRKADTPTAVIHWGTYEPQQTITGSLCDIASLAEVAGLGSPSVIIVGEVVRLRSKLKWFEQRIRERPANACHVR